MVGIRKKMVEINNIVNGEGIIIGGGVVDGGVYMIRECVELVKLYVYILISTIRTLDADMVVRYDEMRVIAERVLTIRGMDIHTAI